MKLCISSVRTGCGLHSKQCGRSHLTSCHTVYCIVNEDNSNVLTAVECVNGLCSTNTSKITVTLVCEHQTVRPQAFYSCCNSRCSSVSSLLPVNIYILVCKYGTSHRRNSHGLICHTHICNYLRNKLVYYSVAATRAVVHRSVVKKFRFLINQILGLNYLFNIHTHSSYLTIFLSSLTTSSGAGMIPPKRP